jgi:hypothetical protein
MQYLEDELNWDRDRYLTWPEEAIWNGGIAGVVNLYDLKTDTFYRADTPIRNADIDPEYLQHQMEANIGTAEEQQLFKHPEEVDELHALGIDTQKLEAAGVSEKKLRSLPINGALSQLDPLGTRQVQLYVSDTFLKNCTEYRQSFSSEVRKEGYNEEIHQMLAEDASKWLARGFPKKRENYDGKVTGRLGQPTFHGKRTG